MAKPMRRFLPSFVLAVISGGGFCVVDAEVRTISSLSELRYNGDDRLAGHVFAYPAGECADIVEKDGKIFDGVWGHEFTALEGQAYADVFGHLEGIDGSAGPPKGVKSDRDCVAACLERGTLRRVVARPLPHRYWNRGEVDDEGEMKKVENFDRFLSSDGCGKVEYGFVNYHTNPVKLYWINAQTGEKVYNQELGVGERQTQFITTFVGHKFEFYDSQPNEDDPTQNELLLQLTVENNGVVGVKNHVQPHVEPDSVEQKVARTLNSEWKRHNRVKRTFSALGFNKGRLPDDVWASLGSYYYNNRNPPHKVLEEWGPHKGGFFVNYWESDCNFIQIPWHLKRRWQGRLLLLTEAWAGCELDITDMYGMREYTKGARLLTHVDRESTHAASMIVNIAQVDIDKPWTVEVFDHADRLHEVVMEPGDIVYYESAKSLHSRNTPLQGGNYINLFTHYRPKGDPEWFTKETPEGVPEPLIDVGKCELKGKLDQYSQGAVQCENPAIGPHLSPTMFQATSGDDLMRWWKSVGPDGNGAAGGDEL